MKKILVIEDCAATRNLLLKSLEAEGFYAIGAENGLVGVIRTQSQLPDLVICDIVMPQLDGYGVLTTLRQDPSSAIIPFIFLTAKVTKAQIRQGMELRADDYLTKPCKVEELLRASAARLEKQTAIRQWCTTLCQQVARYKPADTAILPDSQSIFSACSQLNKVFQFIESNYHQPINVRNVALAVGYSPAYLTNLVKRQTERSIHGSRAMFISTRAKPVFATQPAQMPVLPDRHQFFQHNPQFLRNRLFGHKLISLTSSKDKDIDEGFWF